MNWGQLFNPSGTGWEQPGGLSAIWIALGWLLNWDIVKGLIVFMLAMAAGGQIIRQLTGAVGGMSDRSPRVVTHAAYPGAPSGDGAAQKSSVETDLDQPLSDGEWNAIMEDD
jgi:hypothetical protein